MGTPKKMKNWADLCSDVNWADYHGMWGYRASPGVWFVLRWTNMVDACGRDATYEYHCDVLRVDLSEVDAAEVQSALKCCGLNLDDLAFEYREAATVECLVQHGTMAPLDEFTGDSYPERVRSAARRRACELMEDESALNERLNRPVNAIGTTAREFAKGDVLAGLRRYRDAGFQPDDPRKNIMFKLMGNQL